MLGTMPTVLSDNTPELSRQHSVIRNNQKLCIKETQSVLVLLMESKNSIGYPATGDITTNSMNKKLYQRNTLIKPFGQTHSRFKNRGFGHKYAIGFQPVMIQECLCQIKAKLALIVGKMLLEYRDAIKSKETRQCM